MISGLVPVSIDCSRTPLGSLMLKMKSVEPLGMPFTVARMVCPAVPVYGMLATGCAAVISPVVEKMTGPSVVGGVAPMPVVPFMVACDLRWYPFVRFGRLTGGHEVRVLGGQRVQVRPVLGRVLVPAEEALLEVARRAAAAHLPTHSVTL